MYCLKPLFEIPSVVFRDQFNTKSLTNIKKTIHSVRERLFHFFLHRVKHDLGVSIDVISIEIPLCTDTVHTDRKRAFGS